MRAELVREFLVDLGVFLAVAAATSVVGFVVYLVHPIYPVPIAAMALTAVVVGLVIQRWLWANRLQSQREEILHQAGVEAEAQGEPVEG